MTANAYDVLYNLFVEKIIEIFPKADDWIIFIKPDDVKEDIHLFVFKFDPTEHLSTNTNLGLYTQDMGLEDIPLAACMNMAELKGVYDIIFPPGSENDINDFFADQTPGSRIKDEYTGPLNTI